MLYDFHQYQNEERANSVHATYLVYGSMGAKHDEIDGDVDMSSSIPELESASEIVPVTTLTLVREENLHGTAAPLHVRFNSCDAQKFQISLQITKKSYPYMCTA